jgi:hypothetical protein
VKNESFSDMKAEIMASKPKMIFLIFVLIVGVLGLVSNGLKIPGLQGKAISTTYDQMMEDVYLSGLTSAQMADRKSSYVGKRVSWVGTVTDVKPGSWGNTVYVSDGEEQTLTDYYLEGIPKEESLRLSVGDFVQFSGKIDRIQDGILTGYVYLTAVNLK